MKTLLLGLVGLLVAPAAAQHHAHAPPRNAVSADDPAVADFVARARAATERFSNLDAAIAAGYRTLGPDMPNMGEHWVNPGLAVRRTFDPERPAVLTYVRVDAEPVLTGVAYTHPVRAGEAAPPLPLPSAEWHYHAGRLDDEAFGLVPHAMHEADVSGTRLAMVHAWIWTPNPDGVFAADNWALPYVRLGLPAPERVDPAAAQALFLLDGGVDYYARFIEVAAEPTPSALAAARAVLAAHRERVAALVGAGETASSAFSAVWEAMWEAVAGAVGEEAWARMGPHLDVATHP